MWILCSLKVRDLCGRLRLKCDGTHAETRFRLSAKRTSPFKSAGVSVQSTTGSRGVRISGSNAGYTMFQGSVKCTGYPLHSTVSPSLPLPCVTVYHHISIEFYHERLSLTGHCFLRLDTDNQYFQWHKLSSLLEKERENTATPWPDTFLDIANAFDQARQYHRYCVEIYLIIQSLNIRYNSSIYVRSYVHALLLYVH